MTNEELALLVQSGDRDAATQLWTQTEKLMVYLCRRYFPMCSRYNCEPQDLTQATYFALMDAANAYEPTKGLLFNSYLGFHVQRRCLDALGLRKRSQAVVVSLDEPMPGMEDTTRGDMIPDPNAEAMIDAVVDDDYAAKLHDTLADCLDTLPDEQRGALYAHYYDGQSYPQIAERFGVTTTEAHCLAVKGLRGLRSRESVRKIRQCILDDAYRGGGFRHWRDTGYSSVERAAEQLVNCGE